MEWPGPLPSTTEADHWHRPGVAYQVAPPKGKGPRKRKAPREHKPTAPVTQHGWAPPWGWARNNSGSYSLGPMTTAQMLETRQAGRACGLPLDAMKTALSMTWGFRLNQVGVFLNNIPLHSHIEPEGTVLRIESLFSQTLIKVGAWHWGRSGPVAGVDTSLWVDIRTRAVVPVEVLLSEWVAGAITVVSRPAQYGMVW